jgi:chromate transporter
VIWCGRRLHGTRGAIAAGFLFCAPAVALLTALSLLYLHHGQLPALGLLLKVLLCVVVALVAQAVLRLGQRAVSGPLTAMLAAAGLALAWRVDAFPVALALAMAIGAWRLVPAAAPARDPAGDAPAVSRSALARIAGFGMLLWLLPIPLATLLGERTLALYFYFTKASLLTFGGAYAMLGWVTPDLTLHLGWITPAQAAAGLALAETTPGPLIIVLQFYGFMAAANTGLGDTAAVGAALLAAWAVFLPSFVLVLLVAPFMPALAHAPRVAGALSGVSALVVGLIAALGLRLAGQAWWPADQAWQGPPLSWAVVLTVLSAAWFWWRGRAAR